MKAILSLSLLLATGLARSATETPQPTRDFSKAPALLQQELCRNGRAARAYGELTGDEINEIHIFFSKLEDLKTNFELDVCELMSASPTAMEFLKKVIESDYLKISMLLEISGADSSDANPEAATTDLDTQSERSSGELVDA